MKGMVVAPEPLAAQVGEDILRKGGNAIDAAVAAAFVQGVVNPLLCGIGGTGLMLVYDPKAGESRVLDFSVTCGSNPNPESFVSGYVGRSETIGRYIIEDESNQVGYTSIMTPGFVRGCYAAFEKYGSGNVTWKELVAPAARFASEGFEVYPYIANFMKPAEGRPGYPGIMTKLHFSDGASDLYLKNGRPYREGERLVQAEYGRTLEKIANEGADVFYTGSVSEKIAEDFVTHDALVTPEDLQNFKVLDIAPLMGTYRGYDIISTPPQGSGPQVIEMLNILEQFDVAAMGPGSPDYVELLVKVMRASFIDNVLLKGDPPYTIANDLMQQIMSKDRASFWASKIKAGEPLQGTLYPTGLGSETTHVTTADEQGRVVTFTHSMGSIAGSGVVTPGLGFLYNNFLGHFNTLPGYWDSIVPGKRGGGGVPTMIFKDGKPFMGIGSPGGSRLITSLVQSVVNVIDFGMDMQKAVSVPRLHSEERDLVFIEPAFSDEVETSLASAGYNVERSTYMARMQAVLFGEDGSLHPGADPRGGAGVGAYLD